MVQDGEALRVLLVPGHLACRLETEVPRVVTAYRQAATTSNCSGR